MKPEGYSDEKWYVNEMIKIILTILVTAFCSFDIKKPGVITARY